MVDQRQDEEILEIIDEKKVWDKIFGTLYKIKSFDPYRNSKGIIYDVEHKGDGSWHCNCKSFLFHNGTKDVEIPNPLGEGKVTLPDTCKHIRHVMDKEGLPYEQV